MTIRELINKQTRIFIGTAIIGWLLFAATGVIGAKYIPQPFAGFIGFALFAGAILYSIFLIKCPRCGYKIGQTGITVQFGRSEKQRVNFCPHCGVSFDEQI